MTTRSVAQIGRNWTLRAEALKVAELRGAGGVGVLEKIWEFETGNVEVSSFFTCDLLPSFPTSGERSAESLRSDFAEQAPIGILYPRHMCTGFKAYCKNERNGSQTLLKGPESFLLGGESRKDKDLQPLCQSKTLYFLSSCDPPSFLLGQSFFVSTTLGHHHCREVSPKPLLSERRTIVLLALVAVAPWVKD